MPQEREPRAPATASSAVDHGPPSAEPAERVGRSEPGAADACHAGGDLGPRRIAAPPVDDSGCGEPPPPATRRAIQVTAAVGETAAPGEGAVDSIPGRVGVPLSRTYGVRVPFLRRGGHAPVTHSA